MRNSRVVPVLTLVIAFAVPAPAQETGPKEPASPPVAPPGGQPATPPAPAPPPVGGTLPGGPPPDSPTSPPQGLGREGMWPAPTAEDWKRPVLITFQRTWDDAVAVARETGKPILCCINMDGEIASEHYAGVRYRQSEIAALYEPYVCVVASVYRHNARDYDDEGRRILCPRFGSVTCGEHIWIEPVLYEKFLDGRRIAPRHIMVEPDGTEKYDVFFANDTASIFRTIRDGIANRGPAPPAVVRGDRPVVERVASRDVVDRDVVESAYEKGGEAERRALLDAAAKQGGAAPLDLLRLAVFGLDAEASKLARSVLARSENPAAAELIAEALRVPMEESEREALVAALARLGKASPKAQWLSAVHQGLTARSAAIDVKGWTESLEGDRYPAPTLPSEWNALDARREVQSKAAKDRPEDPDARLELAEACLALAVEAPNAFVDDPKMARVATRQLLEDARRAALEAEKLKATPWRVDTVLAIAAYRSGNASEAYARAEPAVKALPPGEPGWNAMAVLTIFAEGRWKSIQQAVRERRPYPPQWLSDVNAAYSVLLRHPLGTDAQVAWHHELLLWLGARERASRILDAGLGRFPASRLLHDRLRERVLAERGHDALEAVYAKKLEAADAPPEVAWYAGLASVTAAEYHRRAGAAEKALASYARAISHLERAAGALPGRREAADERIAVILGSRARLEYERDDDERATADLLASFERSPGAAGTFDGFTFTPGATAKTVLARLRERKKDDLAAKLGAALAKIDPALLAEPAVFPRNE